MLLRAFFWFPIPCFRDKCLLTTVGWEGLWNPVINFHFPKSAKWMKLAGFWTLQALLILCDYSKLHLWHWNFGSNFQLVLLLLLLLLLQLHFMCRSGQHFEYMPAASVVYKLQHDNYFNSSLIMAQALSHSSTVLPSLVHNPRHKKKKKVEKNLTNGAASCNSHIPCLGLLDWRRFWCARSGFSCGGHKTVWKCLLVLKRRSVGQGRRIPALTCVWS